MDVLLTEDDAHVRRFLDEGLQSEGHSVVSVGSAQHCLECLDTRPFDVAFLDIRLPDTHGVELLTQVRARAPKTHAVVMTGYPEFESVLASLRLGAADYLVKPLEWEAVKSLLTTIAQNQSLDALGSSPPETRDRPGTNEIIGSSLLLKEIRDKVGRASLSDCPVLVEGETGVGKELVARTIHGQSRRATGPFVAVNCSALPAELTESELFGYVKGAFTGASGGSKGLFASAEGGTLFLDEIGDLALPSQPKLLRVLEDKHVRQLGSCESRPVDVRVIAATNQDLRTAVLDGRFRADLFYRLNVLGIRPPALREIRDDIPALAMHCVRKMNRRYSREVCGFSESALTALVAHDFPGNVRELENLIEQSFVMGARAEIGLSDLPCLPGEPKAGESVRPLDQLEGQFVAETLRRLGNDKEKAARALGLSKRTLYRRIKKLSL